MTPITKGGGRFPLTVFANSTKLQPRRARRAALLLSAVLVAGLGGTTTTAQAQTELTPPLGYSRTRAFAINDSGVIGGTVTTLADNIDNAALFRFNPSLEIQYFNAFSKPSSSALSGYESFPVYYVPRAVYGVGNVFNDGNSGVTFLTAGLFQGETTLLTPLDEPARSRAFLSNGVFTPNDLRRITTPLVTAWFNGGPLASIPLALNNQAASGMTTVVGKGTNASGTVAFYRESGNTEQILPSTSLFIGRRFDEALAVSDRVQFSATGATNFIVGSSSPQATSAASIPVVWERAQNAGGYGSAPTKLVNPASLPPFIRAFTSGKATGVRVVNRGGVQTIVAVGTIKYQDVNNVARQRAVYWTRPFDLSYGWSKAILLPASTTYVGSSALAINASGVIVGSVEGTPARGVFDKIAVRWTPSNTTSGALLYEAPGFVRVTAPDKWRRSEATAINASGVIVGNGLTNTGLLGAYVERGFVVR